MPYTGGSQTYNDERIIAYLIGSLDEQETERFDELSISDDEFANRLRVVEDDLVDAYARGALSAETRRGFEAHYLSLPGKRERIRFAETWALRESRQSPPSSSRPRSVADQRRVQWLSKWPLAAAASIVIVLVGYVLYERSKVSAPPGQTAASTPVPAPQAPAPGERGSGSTTAGPQQTTVAIVLMPSTRGIGEPPTLSIPRDAMMVEIRLILEGDDFPTYAVALKEAGSDRVLWNGAGLKSSSTGADRIVIARIDVGLLKPQRYSLDLSGSRASGKPEVISSYSFRVMLK